MTDQPIPTTPAELMEALAAIEHQRWSDWQRYQFHECCRDGGDHDPYLAGSLIIPPEKVQHWQLLIDTAYADLPEHSKQSDRDQVARYWPLIVEFVAEWIRQNCRDFYEGSDEFVRDWREEMAP